MERGKEGKEGGGGGGNEKGKGVKVGEEKEEMEERYVYSKRHLQKIGKETLINWLGYSLRIKKGDRLE